MENQIKKSAVTEERAKQIVQKTWDLADLILENKEGVVENDARFAISSLMHSLTRANISGSVVLGVRKMPVTSDDAEIQAEIENSVEVKS